MVILTMLFGIVENSKLIGMSVTKKLRFYGPLVPFNDLIVISRPNS